MEGLHKEEGSAEFVLPSFYMIRKRIDTGLLVTKPDARCICGQNDIPGFARSDIFLFGT